MEMIDKIDNNQPLSGAASMFPNEKQVLPDNDLDIAVNVDYSSLIQMAVESSQADSEVIEKARESIQTGEIESLENFQKAAENIVTLGI